MPYRLNLPRQVELKDGSPYGKSLVRPVRTVRGGENGATRPKKLETVILEADSIVKVWKDILGVNNLNPETVSLHLEALRQWQSRWNNK